MRGLKGLLQRFVSFVLAMVLGLGVNAAPLAAAETSPPAQVNEHALERAPRQTPTVLRELVERRSENLKHYLYSDGSVKAQISEAPIHFKNESGEWTDIDTNLAPDIGFNTSRTKATPIVSRFGPQTTGSRPVRVEGDGYAVELDMLGVAENAKLVYGSRARSVVTSGSITTTTTWGYDGLRLLGYSASRSNGTTYALDYLYDERGVVFAGVYSASDASSTPFLLVTTDRGDVRELLDASGDSFAYYEYDAYGNPMVTSSRQTSGESTVTAALAAAIAERQVLRYASYAFDAHAGLYYCSQRYYDPRSAAFISKDPARADGEEGAYQYCAGEPVGSVDPSGLTWWRVAYTRLQVLSRTRGVYQLYRNSCHSGSTRWLADKYKSRMFVYFKTWVLDAAIAIASTGRARKYGAGTRSQRLRARRMAYPKAKAAGKAVIQGVVGSELIENTGVLKQSGSYYYFSFVYRYYKKIRPA